MLGTTIRCFVFLTLTFIWISKSASAANIQVGEGGDCELFLSGSIATGDAGQLDDLIESRRLYGRTRLCLNSRGGDLNEALLLVDVIRRREISTIVGRNAICESSCAIVFLAGVTFSDDMTRFDRVISPSARVGLHAPSLIVPEGNFDSETVNRAYQIALRSVVELSQRLLDRGISERLLMRMLLTPPESMYYIDSIGQAIEYELQLDNYTVFEGSIDAIINNICISAEGLTRATSSPWTHMTGVYSSRPVDQLSATEFEVDGFLNEASYSCNVRFATPNERTRNNPSYLGTVSFGVRLPSGEFGGEFGRPLEITNLMTFPAEFPISSLDNYDGQAVEEFLAALSTSSRFSDFSCARNGDLVVVNVNEFVNIRTGPSLRHPIVTRANLGERLTSTDRHDWWYLDNFRGRQCASICERVEGTAALRQAMTSCVEDAQIWQQVRNSREQEGFVSVRFLLPVE